MLESEGFQNIVVESIGSHVWHGFDKWISQTEFHDTWNKNWLVAYQKGLVDYYVITAEKP